MHKPTILIVMGVSGCGKSTIGRLLAKEIDLPYFDGDDFHPAANVEKMSAGEPLTDNDRQSWLIALNEQIIKNCEKGAIIACSALKESYRAVLQNSVEDSVGFIYLKGTFKEIYQRMQERKGHFMPVDLLKSQFETLEPPSEAITVSINGLPEEILQEILDRLK